MIDAWEAAYDEEGDYEDVDALLRRPSSRPTGATQTRSLRTMRSSSCTHLVDTPKRAKAHRAP
jgi:hypothetical protein